MVLVTLGSNLDDWLARIGSGLSKVFGSLRKLYVSIVFLLSSFLLPVLFFFTLFPFLFSVLFVPGMPPFSISLLSNILIPGWVGSRCGVHAIAGLESLDAAGARWLSQRTYEDFSLAKS